jgi:hypothetical protein
MTTPSTPRKAGPLLGTGAQTSWPFTFKVFAASDIAVTIANNLGVETALVLNSDYSVTLNSNQDTSPGGTVTYPISGSALPTGSKLTIFGNLPYDQPLDLPSGGNFSPLALENQLDRLTMQIQQLREQVGRSLQVSVTTSANVGLPPPTASNIIGWNENGDNLENYPLSELATSLAFATYRYDTFTGDGSTTQFTLSADPITLGNLDVAVGGVTQTPGADYLLVAGVLEFTSAPPLGATILARFGEGVASGPSMDSYDVRFRQAGTGSVDRTAEAKMRDTVSVKDFGAVGDGVTDDTAAIQTALDNQSTRAVYFPAGTYRITGSLILNQNQIIHGDGQNDELNNFGLKVVTFIAADGDFNAVTVRLPGSSPYGRITCKNLQIKKVGGSTKTNSGFYSQAFIPEIVLESVTVIGFDKGFDAYTGIAQLNACFARENNTGFAIQSTSTTIQNCYAMLNTVGYLFTNNVYTTLISLAADQNTTAYKFDTGSTGPFTFQQPAQIVDMLNCGAEVASTFMYVDGNWSITCNGPTLDRISQGVYIESARNIIFRNLSFMRPRVNWLYVNTAKCPPDTVVVEGELPPQNQAVPPAPTYSNVPVAMSAFKSQVGVIGLAKTRAPQLDIQIGTNAARGSGSYIYKGKFTARIGPSNSLRFAVANVGNGFRSGGFANLVFYSDGAPSPTDRGGMVYMQTQNVGGVLNSASSTTADITVTTSTAVVGGVTYTYFTISRAAGDVYAYVDIESFTNFEPFQSDMFTIYNAWQASQL